MSEELLIKIIDKVDKVQDHMASMDATLKVQAIQLEEHIKRTELLEERVEPLEDYSKFVKILISLITVSSIVVGLIVGIRTLLH